jgi:hypothetical protein
MGTQYIVLEGRDESKVLWFTTLAEAYRYYLLSPSNRIITRVIEVQINEK